MIRLLGEKFEFVPSDPKQTRYRGVGRNPDKTLLIWQMTKDV